MAKDKYNPIHTFMRESIPGKHQKMKGFSTGKKVYTAIRQPSRRNP